MHCVHIAAQRNDIDTLKLLVDLGADINARVSNRFVFIHKYNFSLNVTFKISRLYASHIHIFTCIFKQIQNRIKFASIIRRVTFIITTFYEL